MPSIGTTAELNPVYMICCGKRVRACFQTILSDEFQSGAVMQVKSFFKDSGGVFICLWFLFLCFVVVDLFCVLVHFF